jgi:hypothetical protein
MKNPGIKFEEFVRAELANIYGAAKRRKASGSVHGQGDVCAGPFEIECKDYPSKKTVTVTETMWLKVTAAARKEGRIPLVVNQTQQGKFVTMSWTFFTMLLHNAVEGEKALEGQKT